MTGQTIATTNLIADSDIPKINLWNMTTYIYNLWFNLTR